MENNKPFIFPPLEGEDKEHKAFAKALLKGQSEILESKKKNTPIEEFAADFQLVVLEEVKRLIENEEEFNILKDGKGNISLEVWKKAFSLGMTDQLHNQVSFRLRHNIFYKRILLEIQSRK